MEYLISSIASFLAFITVYYLKKEHKPDKKYRWLSFSLLFLFTFFVGLYMYKCYEVPIHNSRLSYLFETDSNVDSITGYSDIKIVYDYNTYKEVKSTDYFGNPIDNNPHISVNTYIKCHKDSLNHQWGASSVISYIYVNDSLVKEQHSGQLFGGWNSDAYKKLDGDTDYLEMLRKDSVLPSGHHSSATSRPGSLFMLEFVGVNRQTFFAFTSFKRREQTRFFKAVSAIWTPLVTKHATSVTRYPLCTNHQWDYFKFKSYTVNSSRMRMYSYIPPKDSVIYQETYLKRNVFKKPSIFWTAEDISQAVEVLKIDMDKNRWSNMNINSLSIDYLGPAEFSAVYPEPDYVDMTKLSYKDSVKLDYIVKHGLKYHVTFPDMENLQQIRMWFVTILLSALIALLLQRIRHLSNWQILESADRLIERHPHVFMALIIVIFAVLIFLLVMILIHSNVDAFKLYDDSSVGIIAS